MNNSSIDYTLKNSLCLGCGICEDVCPTQSIEMRKINGEFRPILNKKTCLSIKCGRCLKVCPGIGLNLAKMAEMQFPTEIKNNYIGRCIGTYTGYSQDDDIRFHSASGGLLSHFLIYLLEKHIIEGALVTGFSNIDHITPVSYIARNKDDVLKARGSKYCPVSLNKLGNEIANSSGLYVIVGLPCHIHGFRKRAIIDKRFRERVIGYFTVFCSSNRTFNAQDFILKKYRVNKGDISYFAFRDNGCLGNLVVQQKKSDRKIEVPYTQYYRALRSYFKPRRCLTCIDHYGQLADVCFGDIHVKPYSNDVRGINSCIVRSERFNSLILQAAEDGFIHLDTVDSAVLNESQKEMLYPKKRKAKAMMNIDKYIFHRDVAVYDEFLERPTWSDYISVIITNCQRFIGKHKVLWPIITLLDK